MDSEWKTDHESAVLLIGDFVPIIISLWIVSVFGVAMCKYKCWTPFVIGLICTIGQAVTPMVSETVFFFSSNFWEYVFFVALFFCDKLLYGPRVGFKSVRTISDPMVSPFEYVSMETTSTRKETFSEYNI